MAKRKIMKTSFFCRWYAWIVAFCVVILLIAVFLLIVEKISGVDVSQIKEVSGVLR